MDAIRRWMCLSLVALCGTALVAEDAEHPPAARAGRPVYLPTPNDVEARIVATLGERTEINFSDTPLFDAISFLKDYHHINIVIDGVALQADGIDPGVPVNFELSGVTLRSALWLMLNPLGLTSMVDAEVLVVTTRTKAEQKAVTRIYPAGDLAETPEELESLQDAIRTATQGPWNLEDPSRLGAMSVVSRSKSIVVRQTYAVHDEIVELLTNLRAAQALTDHLDAR